MFNLGGSGVFSQNMSRQGQAKCEWTIQKCFHVASRLSRSVGRWPPAPGYGGNLTISHLPFTVERRLILHSVLEKPVEDIKLA